MIESFDIIFLVMAFSMLFIGIPHGAADILIIFQHFKIKSAVLVVILYFLVFLLGMGLWNIHANLFFFCLWPASIYHFVQVEKELRFKRKIGFEDLMFFSLFTLPCIQLHQFREYMEILDGQYFADIFNSLAPFFYICQLILTFIVLKRNMRVFGALKSLMIYPAVLAITLFFDLITGFAFVFIFIHSGRHLWLSYAKRLISLYSYWLVLLPISLFSFLMIFIFQKQFTGVNQTTLFFMIGLGSLAFPHMILDRVVSTGKKIKRN